MIILTPCWLNNDNSNQNHDLDVYVLSMGSIDVLFSKTFYDPFRIFFSMNMFKMKACKKLLTRASLVAQWLGICLPTQGTRVRALVWEDPTRRGATRPVSHNY